MKTLYISSFTDCNIVRGKILKFGGNRQKCPNKFGGKRQNWCFKFGGKRQNVVKKFGGNVGTEYICHKNKML
jgi:hypothetical protein